MNNNTAALQRLHNHLPLIHTLAKSRDPQTLHYFLNQLTDEQVTVLSDIVRNFLAGNIKVSKGELKHLKQFKNRLREFANPSSRSVKKRKFVKQIGGGIFSILIPAIVSLIAANLR